VMDPAVIQQVLVSFPYSLEKESISRRAYEHIVGSQGLMFAEGDAHKRMRRVIGPSYHNKALVQYALVFLDEAESLKVTLCTMCTVSPQAPLVLNKAVASASCSSIMRSFFPSAVATPARRKKFFSAFSALLEDGVGIAADFLCVILFGKALSDVAFIRGSKFMSRLSGYPVSSWLESRRRLRYTVRDEADNMITESIQLCNESAQRDAADSDSPRMIETIVRNCNAGSRTLTGSELYDTLLTTVTAGQSTVAMSIVWTFYLLAKHSDWQVRVQRELDTCTTWLDSSKSPEDRLHALDGLRILHRVLKESLRINPPVLLPFGRTLKEDILCGDMELPAGSTLTIPIYAMHMNPKYWENPKAFDPDRFLPAAEAAREKMAYLPFLYGPRGCIGHRFAMLEIKCMLGAVLQALDLSVDSDATAPRMVGALSLYPKVNLYARARSRSFESQQTTDN
jgi:cytochrome P450